jgi:hypothetical protein
MADETPNAFEKVINWFKDAADWVQENLGDPALATAIREDLGLAAGEDIPEAQKNQIATFGAGLDPDKASFAETAAEIADIVQALIALGEDLQEDQASGWDVFYLLFRVMASESVRVRSSFVYGLGKLLLLVTEDPEAVEELDPAVVVGLLRGEPPPPGTGEAVLQRIGALTWVVITTLDKLAEKLFADPGDPTDYFEAYYGWDSDPASTTPAADLVSARAVTLLFGPVDQPLGARLSVTFLALPTEHRGPALFFSFGGALNAEVQRGATTFKLLTGVTGGLDLTIPVGSSPLGFTAGGAPQAFVRFDVTTARAGGPAFRIGSPNGTRVDVERFLVGVELAGDRAALRVGLEKAALVIDLTEGDGLLSGLPGGEIRIELGLVLTLDTEHGLRIEGGAQARAVLPINASLFGVFTIHHLEIALGPSQSGRDLTLELSGAFSLHLGPFTATVDRIGMQLDAAFREGNLGVLDAALGFKPPNGLGLALDAGIVKGGGYLFIDHVRGEYAGALELTIGPVSVKAIGLLSTKVPLPDGGEGWALLLLLYFEFPPIQLGFGFTLNGVGGMIGLHHGVSVDALTTGLRDGVLDDILFPKNPVADAPRIVNRLRVVFPVTVRSITFGLMLKLGWGTPEIVVVSMGFIVQLDNVLPPGDAPVEFSRFVLVGQLRVQMLPEKTGTPPLLKLLVDILGFYDAEAQKLGFVARLRDSKVAEITLSGMLVVQADFGAQPSFVLAAGGFHPRFKDIPPGTPAPIDRLAVGFNISVVKITIEGYFAVAAATVQAGATLRAQAKFGPVSIDGWLGFDAIFFFEPRFHFEVDVRAGVAIKYKGHNLASVDFKGTFSGPGLWRITGSVSFEILFWDIEKSFDESIGSAPETPALSTDVAALVRQELSNPGNWTAQLPAGGQGMVSLGSIEGADGVLAHPLGRLQVTQRVAPLGLTLQRFGQAQVSGANRFEIAEVRVGTQVLASPPEVTESFARAHFVDMTEEEKLAQPSFERFTSGFSVGTDVFTVASDQPVGDLEYETHYLRQDVRFDRYAVRFVDVRARLTADGLRVAATLGAVARSDLHRAERIRPPAAAQITVTDAPLVVAATDDLTAAATLTGTARYSTAAAAEELAGVSGGQLVEAFEVV